MTGNAQFPWMAATEIHGRFLPSRVYSRWKWTVRCGLMLVPFVMLLSGGIQIYLAAGKFRSCTLFELENGPSPREIVELVESRSVLERVVGHLELNERMRVDRDSAIEILKGNMTAKVVPDTRLVEIKVTLNIKEDARDAADDIPASLKQHLEAAEEEKIAGMLREIADLISEASDTAGEKATVLANLEKVHGPKPEDTAFALKHQRANRESLLADAEVERLRNLRSACITENLDERPKLIVHSAPVISNSPVNPKGDELGELALRCLIVGLLCALLLPYLMELAFPPRRERVSKTDPVEFL
jgi:hypothetical protein